MKHPKYKDVWTKSFGKEIRCLATTTETIFFINKHEIPKERQGDVTYGRIVCVYRNGKKDKYLTRITMGSNLIHYPGNCGTPTADLLTVKLLFNSIISTPWLGFPLESHPLLGGPESEFPPPIPEFRKFASEKRAQICGGKVIN